MRSWHVRNIALALFALLPLFVAFRPAPKPIGPDGRALYSLVRLSGGELAFGELVRLGFDVERNGVGETVAYVSPAEAEKLEAYGFRLDLLPDPGLEALKRGDAGPAALLDSYHNYDALTSALQQVANDHPAIARLSSAGKSVEGRDLWWMKISDNPDADEDEPGFKYISTIHGDEVVGVENCLKLIDWLTDRYASDPRVRRLVDEVEIWIMPLMNPDGNARSQRYNAQGVDLNRDFPDRIEDPVDTTAGRATETGRLMNWQSSHWTTLSANFHGGALVTNYPWDGNASHQSVYTASPDDALYRDISLEYSEDNLPMYNGSFSQGITNGADWYVIYGGMQDWNYFWRGDMQVTIEISNNKWPPASQLPQFWEDNREAMLSYMERVLTGVRGTVTDAATGAPLAARLTIVGRDLPFFTAPAVGDFHRAIEAGSHQLRVEVPGYETQVVPFTVTDAQADAVRLHVRMGEPAAGNGMQVAGWRVASDTNANTRLEPGESGALAVTLRNLDANATGIFGELQPITPYAAVSSGAGWPDLSGGSLAESLPPHFALDVAPDTPAGHKLGFFVEWRTAEGGAGTTDAFLVPTGVPATSQTPASGLPKVLPDQAVVTSSVTIPDDREIAEVNVWVDVRHQYIGDLRISLVAPDGTTVRLHDRQGGQGQAIQTWYDTQTQPVDSLARFVGHSSQGTWTLRIEDLGPTHGGVLQGWTLELLTYPWEDPLPEVRLRGIARTDEGTRLEWWPVGSAATYHVYRAHDPRSADAYADVTAEDDDPADRAFLDASPAQPGQLTFWIVSADGHTGEGLWGHYGR